MLSPVGVSTVPACRAGVGHPGEATRGLRVKKRRLLGEDRERSWNLERPSTGSSGSAAAPVICDRSVWHASQIEQGDPFGGWGGREGGWGVVRSRTVAPPPPPPSQAYSFTPLSEGGKRNMQTQQCRALCQSPPPLPLPSQSPFPPPPAPSPLKKKGGGG